MSKSRIGVSFVSAFLLMFSSVGVRAEVIQQIPGTDFILFEAEQYDSIEGDEFTTWLEVEPDGDVESEMGAQVLPPDSNVSGTALFDQMGDANFVDVVTWKLQFAEAGFYTYYMRFSMFDMQDPTNYANEDSAFFPLELGDWPEQDGWFSFPKQGHDDSLEDPPYWEGQFNWAGPINFNAGGPIEYEVRAADVGTVLDFSISTRERGGVLDAIVFSQDPGLLPEDLEELLEEYGGGGGGVAEPLRAGDSDMDCDFDPLDLVLVQQRAKYLTGEAATWGDGDWDGAPGGSAPDKDPPPGNGLFDQLDIIAALAAGTYLQGNYCGDGFAAIAPVRIAPDGQNDQQASIVYDAGTGEVSVNAPASTKLTSVNIDSASGIFANYQGAQNLDGSFDTSSQDNIFKATFGDVFDDTSFGMIAQAGLSAEFVADDLTVIGSLEGGGGLGDVDLIYVPEPSTIMLLGVGLVSAILLRRRR